MKILAVVLALLITVAFGSNVMSSMPGKTVEYEGGTAGPVIFDGSTHGPEKGMKCADCHPTLFQMKKGSFKMPLPHKAEFCGVCHDGKRAFGQIEPENCAKCHKKLCPPPQAGTPKP